MTPDKNRRYAKQIRFSPVGAKGQEALAASHAVIIGCGALGSVSANLLARAGVGSLLVVDRDFVELDNLQRQVLYDESDVGQPKAIRAAERMRAINSTIRIEGEVADVNFRNIEQYLAADRKADVVIDGTDNFEIRFLINDACVHHGIPWVYAGCIGVEGQTMTILPGESACLRCLMSEGPPLPGTTETCDTGGILSTIINVLASIQTNEALKILSGNVEAVSQRLSVFDLWSNRYHSIGLDDLWQNSKCPVCKGRDFEWLQGRQGSQTAVLCGRNAVQVSFPDQSELDLEQIAARLQPIGQVEWNEWLVRLSVDDFVITAFRDGRAIINGTEDVTKARRLYAQYLGS